jgi:hypothetical protein
MIPGDAAGHTSVPGLKCWEQGSWGNAGTSASDYLGEREIAHAEVDFAGIEIPVETRY